MTERSDWKVRVKIKPKEAINLAKEILRYLNEGTVDVTVSAENEENALMEGLSHISRVMGIPLTILGEAKARRLKT